MFNDFELRVNVSLQRMNEGHNEPTAARYAANPSHNVQQKFD